MLTTWTIEELRNHIYTHVIDASPKEVRLIPPPYPLCMFSRTPNRILGWSRLRRQALGLTQVCRLLRNEFLPMHHQCIPAYVPDVAILAKFVAVSFPILERAHGTVVLSPLKKRPVHIDLAPLIRLLLTAPELTIKLEQFFEKDVVCLRSIIDVRSNDTWRIFFERAVTSAVYVVPRTFSNPQLRLEITRSVVEPWMACKPKGNVDGPIRSQSSAFNSYVEDWVQRIGLGDIAIRPHRISISVGHIHLHDAGSTRDLP